MDWITHRWHRGLSIALCVLIVPGLGLVPSLLSGPADTTRELKQLIDADQREPLPPNLPTEPAARERVFRAYWEAHFKPRRDRALALVEGGQLSSPEDYELAGTLLNHSLYADDHLVAHLLFTIAARKGHEGARWESAAALDNYLSAIGRPQLFGTLWGSPGRPDEDRSGVMGAPMADSLRREFCVPALPRQAALLDSLRQGDVETWRRGKIDCGHGAVQP